MRNITLRIRVMSTILSTLCNIAVNYLRVFEVENLCKRILPWYGIEVQLVLSGGGRAILSISHSNRESIP